MTIDKETVQHGCELAQQFVRYVRKLPGDILFLTVLIIFFIWGLDSSHNAGTILFAAMAAFFTYKSYKTSQEKLRLDLFEKRFLIYEELVTFCSNTFGVGQLVPGSQISDELLQQMQTALNAADNSFRGHGYHKSRALFGPEIHQLLTEINGTYSWLRANSRRPDSGMPGYEDWPKEAGAHLQHLREVINNLPDILRPYVYFGDIKNPDLKVTRKS